MLGRVASKTVTLIMIASIFLLAGCGSTASNSNMQTTGSGATGTAGNAPVTGNVSVTFQGTQGGKSARAVPPTAVKFIVHLVNADTGLDVVPPITATRSSATSQVVVTFTNIPVGNYRVFAQLLDQTGATVGYATPGATVVPGRTVTIDITATTTVTSVTVSPSSAGIAVGATQTFTAIVNFNDGTHTPANSAVAWNSSNTSIASVNATGVATGLSGGSTNITATTSDKTGSAQLTVGSAAPSPSPTPTPSPSPVRPTVTSVSPVAGPLAGGIVVTVTGTNFVSGATVSFGGTSGTSITINSATQLTVTAPAHAAGTIDVTVTTAGGTSAIGATDKYTYTTLPTVASVSPTGGPIGGGNTVTVTGSGFTGASAVRFGTTAGSAVIVNSDTQLTVTAPAHTAGTVDITVITPGGTSAIVPADQYQYSPLPIVGGVAPSAGPIAGGTSVVLTGSGFTGATAVSFGATPASAFTVDSDAQITATSPAHVAGTIDITVTTPGGTSATSVNDQYTYCAVPSITGIIPNAGPVAGGTSVAITGTGLALTSSVTFGGVAATSFTVNSDTSVTAVSPAHATGVTDVQITTPGGTTSNTAADDFTYCPIPSLTSIDTPSGTVAGNTIVVITGSGFTLASAVNFGTNPAVAFSVDSDTQITAHSAGNTANTTVDITVTTPGGTTATSSADQFLYGHLIVQSKDTSQTFTASLGDIDCTFNSNAGGSLSTPNTVDGGTAGAAFVLIFAGKATTNIVVESTSAGVTQITFDAGSGGQTVKFKNISTAQFTNGNQTAPYPFIP